MLRMNNLVDLIRTRFSGTSKICIWPTADGHEWQLLAVCGPSRQAAICVNEHSTDSQDCPRNVEGGLADQDDCREYRAVGKPGSWRFRSRRQDHRRVTHP